MAKYMVQMEFTYGWDDAGWESDGEPWRFDTIEEAQAEINDLCESFPDGSYHPEDFRIVPDPEGDLT